MNSEGVKVHEIPTGGAKTYPLTYSLHFSSTILIRFLKGWRDQRDLEGAGSSTNSLRPPVDTLIFENHHALSVFPPLVFYVYRECSRNLSQSERCDP